eukprot:TRINITY_DN13932_c0_g1_i1.p1 TRINITY_DN13932_c0_g1~~TRINITY_DN13932_c0_g1_i1.p1  ORF type:complete len:128 (-),score=26.58 TRINITY_DN13932_c0_g1_i1:18-401(-)
MSTASAQANLTIGPFGWHLYLLAVAIYVLQKLTHSLHPYLLLAFDVFFILYTGAFMSMRFFGVAQCVGSNVPLSIRNGWWKYPLYALGTLMGAYAAPVSYTHLRAHETSLHLVCRLLLEKKKKKKRK